jgi:alkanesulfonate monooxygenase SsuD/methylene tetrahydromethanopterin reductase-like flavin-dependent oxidoreductase (luciferase family)
MTTLRFGYFPEPRANALDDLIRRVTWADANGLDLVGIQDHPYQRRYADTFALLAHLAAVTDRITLLPDVASLPLRGPAMIAKQAATIDLLSRGRFELGLGAGGFWDAIAALGGPRRSPGESLQALREAIAVIRALWTEERGLRTAGEHYRLAGVHGGPMPAHDVGIWIGGYGPRMMRLIGETADGWIPSMAYLPPSELAERAAIMDEAALRAGRDPGSIRRIYNVSGSIQNQTEDDPRAIVGPPSLWADRLLRLAADHRIDTVILWTRGDEDEQLERFALEVVPQVRAASD